ncbi:MAG: hypothetical protein Q8Q00_11055 [Dehalococcoidia bacterium]|nr:hypothetical protein [Dehalococcoidia bacterium]
MLAAVFVMLPTAPELALAAPANDNLADAIAIATPATSGIVATGSNVGATTEGSENQPCDIGATVWYTWISPASTGTVVFDTWGSDFDTVLAVYTGSGFPLTNVGCNDDLFPSSTRESVQSTLALTYAASTTYRIQVGGYSGTTGNVVLNMSLGAAIYVNSIADTDTRDGAITLREAMLLAAGDLAFGSLDAGEQALVLNSAAGGASGSDLIHFANYTTFPPTTPSTIAIGSELPYMDVNGDVVSGIGAGVIVDGQNLNIFCFGLIGNGNHIEGLQIRRCAGATSIAISGDDNVIGGSVFSGQRNVIREGAVGVGIGLYSAATGNKVVGNFIGTDASGTVDMGMSDAGVGLAVGAVGNTIGGAGPGEGNLISGNDVGVYIAVSSSNTVIGNKIGTDAAGTGPLGNTTAGVRASAFGDDNIIGGTAAGEANIIAFNGTGVWVDSGVRNTIRGNSIHSNSLLGINTTVGGNLDLPAPAIGSVAGGTVSGFACALCTVDVYNDLAEEGRVHLGSDSADAAGNFSLSGVAHPLADLTATATDAAGNTSEFSAAFAAAPNSDGDGLSDAEDGCPFDPEDYDGFQDGDGCPDTDNDLDGVPDVSDSAKMVFDPAGTLPSPTVDCKNIPEDVDAFKDSDGCPEPDNDNDGHPDVGDMCPGTDSLAGGDGMLGAPQDLNHNGKRDDPPEAAFSTDDVVLTFEDYDGVIDVDGCHDSPGGDFDGDTFTDDSEALFLGTNPMNGCSLTATANDENPDPWPFDFDDNQRAALADVMGYIPVFNSFDPNPPYNPRYDLNQSGGITLADVMLYIPVFNKICIPP